MSKLKSFNAQVLLMDVDKYTNAPSELVYRQCVLLSDAEEEIENVKDIEYFRGVEVTEKGFKSEIEELKKEIEELKELQELQHLFPYCPYCGEPIERNKHKFWCDGGERTRLKLQEHLNKIKQ